MNFSISILDFHDFLRDLSTVNQKVLDLLLQNIILNHCTISENNSLLQMLWDKSCWAPIKLKKFLQENLTYIVTVCSGWCFKCPELVPDCGTVTFVGDFPADLG